MKHKIVTEYAYSTESFTLSGSSQSLEAGQMRLFLCAFKIDYFKYCTVKGHLDWRGGLFGGFGNGTALRHVTLEEERVTKWLAWLSRGCNVRHVTGVILKQWRESSRHTSKDRPAGRKTGSDELWTEVRMCCTYQTVNCLPLQTNTAAYNNLWQAAEALSPFTVSHSVLHMTDLYSNIDRMLMYAYLVIRTGGLLKQL